MTNLECAYFDGEFCWFQLAEDGHACDSCPNRPEQHQRNTEPEEAA